MNKKQRNRKIVTQNKRNGMINRRYSSTIKTLYKLFQTKIKFYNLLEDTKLDEKIKLKLEIKNITNNFYSILYKAVKKNLHHSMLDKGFFKIWVLFSLKKINKKNLKERTAFLLNHSVSCKPFDSPLNIHLRMTYFIHRA